MSSESVRNSTILHPAVWLCQSSKYRSILMLWATYGYHGAGTALECHLSGGGVNYPMFHPWEYRRQRRVHTSSRARRTGRRYHDVFLSGSSPMNPYRIDRQGLNGNLVGTHVQSYSTNSDPYERLVSTGTTRGGNLIRIRFAHSRNPQATGIVGRTT